MLRATASISGRLRWRLEFTSVSHPVLVVSLYIVAFAFAGAIDGEATPDTVIGSVRDLLSAEAYRVLEDALTTPSGREGATIVGSIVVAWSGAGSSGSSSTPSTASQRR